MSNVPDFETLEEAKAWLRTQLKAGAECPCCTQFAKVYERKLYSTMARHLINLYWKTENNPSEDYHHISTFCPKHPGDFAKLLYWGFIEEMPKDEEDKSKRTSGYWQITERGKKFVRNEIVAFSHIKLYDGRMLTFSGKRVGIKEALGKDFDYEELMQNA